MSNRDFSDTVKLESIKSNLKINNGEIHCGICGTKLLSIDECHFDHIIPYAKGGKSILSNCQILCIDCNLKKNDKELKDFVLEEKAKRFLEGKDINVVEESNTKKETTTISNKMTKELFDELIKAFIDKKGDIHKVDFGREYNNLPSIYYVKQYYGDINELKKAFDIEDLSYSWNRETIKKALVDYINSNGTISQKDLTKANKLPSLPCILSYYPEYANFTDIKRELCDIEVQDHWTYENAIEAGKVFAEKNGKITLKDLRSTNKLPTGKVIYRLFGSMAEYQKKVGIAVSQTNEFISKEEIDGAVKNYFKGKQRIIESRGAFLKTFPYSLSTILKRYGTFSDFCKEQKIQVLKSRKLKYTKREVDDAVSKWVKNGNKIPAAKELSKLGLPSLGVILKFYEDWKEPFYFYEKLFEEAKRN